MPSLVPTLNKEEIDNVLNENYTPAIKQKIVKHAIKRMKEGKSTFWEEGESTFEIK